MQLWKQGILSSRYSKNGSKDPTAPFLCALLRLPRCSLLQAVCADLEQRAEQSASDNARLSTRLEALLGKKSELEETNERLRSQLAEHDILLIQEKEKVRWQPSQF